jgi:hypothetical protein
LVIDRSLVNFDDENKSRIIEYRDQKIGDNASNNLFRIRSYFVGTRMPASSS